MTKDSPSPSQRQPKTEAAISGAEAERFASLTPFERIIPRKRLSPPAISDQQRSTDLQVFFDFETAFGDFDQHYDMRGFKVDIITTLTRLFGSEFRPSDIYGAGSFDCFDKVSFAEEAFGDKIYNLEQVDGRTTSCQGENCSRQGNAPPPPLYERISNRACDLISEEMLFYPIQVGHTQGKKCNVLIITGNTDFGIAMRALKDLGATVFLAHTSDTSERLLECATSTMHIREFFMKVNTEQDQARASL